MILFITGDFIQGELQQIKDKYGEAFAHFCRDLFPSILEKKGTLFSLLSKKFAYNKNLYDDIIGNRQIDNFKNYIYSFINTKPDLPNTNKNPFELMDEAGYDLYECKCEADIQKFKKYYEKDEELCTFKGHRLDSCYVFFAIKKDVDEIKRANFKNPKREDEYGTSVISLQFSKGKFNNLSIKNRYNHMVNNPDATFYNNLDNIIEGLTDSFEVFYDLHINNQVIDFNIDEYKYVRANYGKFYKYNYELDGIYYCSNNIIIDNFEVINAYENKSRYIFMDTSILDLSKKIFITYNKHYDTISFIDSIPYIDKVDVQNISKEKRKIIITCDQEEIIIILDKL